LEPDIAALKIYIQTLSLRSLDVILKPPDIRFFQDFFERLIWEGILRD